MPWITIQKCFLKESYTSIDNEQFDEHDGGNGEIPLPGGGDSHIGEVARRKFLEEPGRESQRYRDPVGGRGMNFITPQF